MRFCSISSKVFSTMIFIAHRNGQRSTIYQKAPFFAICGKCNLFFLSIVWRSKQIPFALLVKRSIFANFSMISIMNRKLLPIRSFHPSPSKISRLVLFQDVINSTNMLVHLVNSIITYISPLSAILQVNVSSCLSK